VLTVVHAHFEVDWSRPEWIEDELVRRGARDAHMLPDDIPTVAVTVSARSREEANAVVCRLLDRVGAYAVEIVPPSLAARILLQSRVATASEVGDGSR
jgi:hypothetical protein